MTLRLPNGYVMTTNPVFLFDVLQSMRTACGETRFSWIYANKTCVGYELGGVTWARPFPISCGMDGLPLDLSTAKKVTKRFTVCIDVDGLWCTVLCVSSVRQGQGGVEWSAFTLTQFNTRGPCNARVYYYPIRGRHDIIVVTCTWRHALLRFKHVLRTRARRRIASHVCDVLPRIIIDVSLVIASYIV